MVGQDLDLQPPAPEQRIGNDVEQFARPVAGDDVAGVAQPFDALGGLDAQTDIAAATG